MQTWWKSTPPARRSEVKTATIKTCEFKRTKVEVKVHMWSNRRGSCFCRKHKRKLLFEVTAGSKVNFRYEASKKAKGAEFKNTGVTRRLNFEHVEGSAVQEGGGGQVHVGCSRLRVQETQNGSELHRCCKTVTLKQPEGRKFVHTGFRESVRKEKDVAARSEKMLHLVFLCNAYF